MKFKRVIEFYRYLDGHTSLSLYFSFFARGKGSASIRSSGSIKDDRIEATADIQCLSEENDEILIPCYYYVLALPKTSNIYLHIQTGAYIPEQNLPGNNWRTFSSCIERVVRNRSPVECNDEKATI